MDPNQNQQANPQPQAQASQQPQPVQDQSQNQQSSSPGSTQPSQEKKGMSKKVKIIIIAVIILGSLPFLMILLSILLIAINPARQFDQADEIKRQSAVTQILNAVGAYYADNNGVFPSGISSIEAEISSNGADICEDIIGSYIPSIPVDPSLDSQDVYSCDESYSTGYMIILNNDGTVTVSAPNATTEGGISVTR